MASIQKTQENNKTVSGDAMSTDYARIAQQMYTQNAALAQTNRTLSILRTIDLLILDSTKNLKQLGKEIARSVIDASPYVMAGILSLDHYKDADISMQGFSMQHSSAANQDSTMLLSQLHMPIETDWAKSDKRNSIIDLSNLNAADELRIFDTNHQSLRTILHDEIGIHHLYITKLESRKKVTGIMMVGLSNEPNIDDIELIERLAEPTGIAVDNRLLFEENRKVVLQLQQMNDKLTEIDSTKDEFISMASHQLRTPLTSMKGYVSMVLDGDVGDINEQQRTMLQQAFDSSQRMVYVISDLLNVSRLRSGKFTITTSPINLADIMEGELRQLSASANARNISFVYTKPESFPIIDLDEMKIRQVIMNFLDNALYYTQSGGHVTIDLRHTANEITCAITDTGLGVPKKEQPYLFTKFYRAQNARKMRPDGTGLGLYMAKKVIVAQGGSVIFSSEEGAGSTFGFRFQIKQPDNLDNEYSHPKTK